MKHELLTEQIIQAFYKAYNILGFGFLEKVYQNALMHELQTKNLSIEPQKRITVFYLGNVVGEYFADIVVEGKVIIEVKACMALIAEHESQLLNYLRATDIEVGLLVNFGKKAELRRKVFDNDRKKRP